MRTEWREWAPLVLRLMLGFGFLYHGLPKLFSATGHEEFVGMLGMLGVPVPGLVAYLVGIVEVGGAIALLLGVYVWLATIPLIIVQLVAMFTVHLPNGFNFIHIVGMENGQPVFGMPGVEVNMLYLAGLISLMLSGAGALSIDAARAPSGAARPSPDVAA